MVKIDRRELSYGDIIESKLRARIAYRSDGCWEWVGSFNEGRPQFMFYTEGRVNLGVGPRSFLYNRLYGHQLGYTYRSTCLNSKCVNPAHHRRLTIDDYWQENTRRLPNGCVEWTGKKNNKGYGVANHVDIGKGNVLAHRFAFFRSNGYYPEPMGLHTCDNTWCVNADHIFEGTAQDNTDDMMRKGRHGKRFSRNGDCLS